MLTSGEVESVVLLLGTIVIGVATFFSMFALIRLCDRI
jgi:hypothetical protein